VDFSGSEGGIDSVGLGDGVAAPILGAFVKATGAVKLESLANVVKNKDAMYKGYDQASIKSL
jgi:oxalate oxidoreductase subunit delta